MNARLFLAWLILVISIPENSAQTTSPPGLAYRLLEGSTLVDDCLICGRPSLVFPLRGTFTLVRTNSTPVGAQYALRDIDFYTGVRSNAQHLISGQGHYESQGHFVVQQDMVLDVLLNNVQHRFTNENRDVIRQLPTIEIDLVQTQQNLVQFYSMHLLAVPLREVWFSMTNLDTRSVVSSDGHVVKTIFQLTDAFDFPPLNIPPLSDALDILPGGEILFSLVSSAFSQQLNTNIYEGDLLSNRGRIVRRNQQLTERLGFMPVVPDLGLDAVAVLDHGEILFSIRTNAFSERLGMVRRGDLLSARGEIVLRNEELIGLFNPVVVQDFGLDAVHVWPHQDIWFSTEMDFEDRNLGHVSAGDLLSIQGFIVYRNRELTAPFRSAGQTNDFGLDSLFVVTDYIQPVPPPQFTNTFLTRNSLVTCARFEWAGMGRVFQLQHATDIAGPWQAGPIQPDTSFQVCPPAGPSRFYRLRQW